MKSLLIMVIFLGAAFTVVAMVPSNEDCCNDVKPLEVQKDRISGPVVVVLGDQALWELEITVTNNLDEDVEVVEPDVEEPIVFYATRSEGIDYETTQTISKSTIMDVVVKDTIPSEFELTEFTPSQGDVRIEIGDNSGTSLTWDVGILESKAQATLLLRIGIIEGVFSKAGDYVLNSGATASGFLPSTQEILYDGPTEPLYVTVIHGTPNEAPIADAGCDQMAFEKNPVYLDGSGSYDPDGTIVKYSWYLGTEWIGSARSVLSYLLPVGVHEVELVVEDNFGKTASDMVTITIYKENAEVEGGVMYGVVRDATTRQGFDPYIEISNENFAISTWTDMGGNYRIIGIPAGNYRVFCKSDGYQDHHGEVYIPENGEVEYDIGMIRI
ncbi:MAG: hypothetical protein JSV09_00585 [Thermoplasmata archaeon]|nr:MAG: hypothetical protein JSV09_00585 [Thermoplasmata archaeon]